MYAIAPEHKKAELALLLDDYFVMNPNVSKKRFAKSFNIAPETVSRYLAGKTLPNYELQRRIMSRIGYGKITIDDWLKTIEKDIKFE